MNKAPFNPVFDPAPLVPLVLRQRTWQPTHFVRLTYNNHTWGFMHHELAQSLGQVGLLTQTTPRSPNQAQLILPPCAAHETTEIFEAQLDAAVAHLIAQGLVNEDHYAPEDRDYVAIEFDPTLAPAKLARHYSSSFGVLIKGTGIFLSTPTGLWLSQRGPNVYNPNVLDHTSGGLVTFGTNIVDTAKHELADELILPDGLDKKLRAYSRVSMCFQPSSRRLTRLLNYHFQLPIDANLVPQANEAPDVLKLVYMNHANIYTLVLSAPEKFTPYAVSSLTDFWYHHGFFDADNPATHQLHHALYTPLEIN